MRCEVSAPTEPRHAHGVLSVAPSSVSQWLFLFLALFCFCVSPVLTAKVFFCVFSFFTFSATHQTSRVLMLLGVLPLLCCLTYSKVSSFMLSTVLPLHQGLQRPCSPSFPLSPRNGKVQRGQRTLCCVFFDPATGLGIGGHYGACVSHLRQVQEQTTWEANGLLHRSPGTPANTPCSTCPFPIRAHSPSS